MMTQTNKELIQQAANILLNDTDRFVGDTEQMQDITIMISVNPKTKTCDINLSKDYTIFA